MYSMHCTYSQKALMYLIQHAGKIMKINKAHASAVKTNVINFTGNRTKNQYLPAKLPASQFQTVNKLYNYKDVSDHNKSKITWLSFLISDLSKFISNNAVLIQTGENKLHNSFIPGNKLQNINSNLLS